MEWCVLLFFWTLNRMGSRKDDVCFLYSEVDKDTAKQLEDALSFYSIEVWKNENIAIGEKIVKETERVLGRAKIVIVLWSKSSIKSAFLKNLASRAKEEKKIVIPVLIASSSKFRFCPLRVTSERGSGLQRGLDGVNRTKLWVIDAVSKCGHSQDERPEGSEQRDKIQC
jgi:hypothetical protein